MVDAVWHAQQHHDDVTSRLPRHIANRWEPSSSVPSCWHSLQSPKRTLPARRGGALVGMEYGFMGPNYSISTACATANYCFVAAANHIRNGEADMILAGGSEAPIIPVGLGGFVACRRGDPAPALI